MGLENDAESAPLQGTVADMLADKGSTVYAVPPQATVFDAVEMMDDRRVGALLVMDADRLVGIISERDYTRKVILHGRASRETRVSDIMTPDVITVPPELGLADCLALVTARRVRHLPVVRDGKVVGILSIGDLVRAVVAQQAETIQNLRSYILSDYPK
jgi:CBS domain-containing protein